MKVRWTMVAGILAVGATVSAASMRTRVAAPAAVDAAFAHYDDRLQQLDRTIVALDVALATGDTVVAREAFRRARSAYKEVELFVEYYGSGTMRELNGVPMDKAVDEDPETPLPPVGLQMVEAALYSNYAADSVRAARRYVRYMRSAVGALRRAGADSMPGDAYLFDAMRQEIARVSALGIAGFDATLSGAAIEEAADALDGVRGAFAPYRSRATSASAHLPELDEAFTGAIGYLHRVATVDHIDRIEFLARYAVPLAHRLADTQRALGIGRPEKPRAWSAGASSIYDGEAFDRAFFAATDAPSPTTELVTLGRELFYETSLSASGTRSCATCHNPSRAFTDGLPRASLLVAHGVERPSRNTPTLINAALQPTLFADGRVRTLEDQATDVIGNSREMGGSLDRAAAALRARPAYIERFSRAFPGNADTALSGRTLRLALAAYVRTLVALDARFDRAVRGNDAAMSAEERRGFDLFMGKAACGTCHFAPLFNGATPPMLTESEPEVIGVPATPAASRARIDPDSGRFNVRRIDQHLHAFRTPTLRNIELTAPYMHNGVYRTLEEVIDFYDAGGGHGIGAALPHQTLPADSLHLDRAEKRAIIAFLRTLTDTVTH